MGGGMGYNMVALAKGKDREGGNVSIIRTAKDSGIEPFQQKLCNQ